MTLRYLRGVKSCSSMTTFNWIREDEEATRIWQTNLSSSPRAIYRTRLRPPRTLFKARKSVGVDLTRSSRISLRADLCAPSRAGLRPLALRLSPFAVATCNGSFMLTPAIPERPRESRSPPKCDLRRGDPQCPLHVCAVTSGAFQCVFGRRTRSEPSNSTTIETSQPSRSDLVRPLTSRSPTLVSSSVL